jgi:archaellum component FlaC
MEDRSLEEKIDRLNEGLNGIKKDVGEIKFVLEGSQLGVTGLSKRVSELEKRVMEIKVFYWKAVGVASVMFPILIYVVQKYLL